MSYKLKNLTIDRVDLVDQGANPGAKVVFYKRRPGAATPELGRLSPEEMDDAFATNPSLEQEYLQQAFTKGGLAPAPVAPPEPNPTRRSPLYDAVVKAAKKQNPFLQSSDALNRYLEEHPDVEVALLEGLRLGL